MKCGWVKILLAGALLIAGAGRCEAENWSQYRGPRGDGISMEKMLPLPATGPKRLWNVSTPNGFSSFAVADGKAFTVISRNIDGAPFAVCLGLDAASGRELWGALTGIAKFPQGGDNGAENNRGGDGPRSTPAVSGNRVYVYSADLVLHCFDAADGRPIWKHDIAGEFRGPNISWKSAMSPVIDGERLYLAGGGPGASMLAFNNTTGELLWKAGDEAMTHATPVVATIHGVRQVIYLMQSGLVAVDATNGKGLWKFSFPFRTATGCSPAVTSNLVFCTAGYEVGGAACEVVHTNAAFEARELWRNKGNGTLASLWSTPVCKDGYLYGMISYKKFSDGPLKCVELKTGTVRWEQPGFGTGNVLLAGNYLVALTDNGRVVVAEANPAGYKEIGQFKAIEGKCWSSPAWCDGRLYVRSTKEGACFEFGPAR